MADTPLDLVIEAITSHPLFSWADYENWKDRNPGGTLITYWAEWQESFRVKHPDED